MAVVWFVVLVSNGMLQYKAYTMIKKKKDIKISKLIFGISTSVCFWMLCELLMQLLYNHTTIMILHELKFFAVLSLPTMFYRFAINLDKRNKKKFMSTANIVIPIIFLVIIYTNTYHKMFRGSMSVNAGSINVVEVSNGVMYYLMSFYVYSLLIVSVVLMIRHYMYQPKIYRKHISFLIIGIIMSISLNVLYQVMHAVINWHFDITPITFGFVAWMFYYAYYIYEDSDVAAFAKDFILENMNIGVAFLDRRMKLYYTNKYFEKLMGTPFESTTTRDIESLPTKLRLAIYKGLESKDTILYKNTTLDKISIFQVTVEEIKDEQKRFLGTLIYLQDVTEEEQKIANLKVKQYLSDEIN